MPQPSPEIVALSKIPLGGGYLVREDPARDGVQLSGRDGMYAAAFAGIFPYIVLQSGSVRIVAVDLL